MSRIPSSVSLPEELSSNDSWSLEGGVTLGLTFSGRVFRPAEDPRFVTSASSLRVLLNRSSPLGDEFSVENLLLGVELNARCVDADDLTLSSLDKVCELEGDRLTGGSMFLSLGIGFEVCSLRYAGGFGGGIGLVGVLCDAAGSN